MSVETIWPRQNDKDWRALARQVAEASPPQPFSEKTLAFFARLATLLQTDGEARSVPDLAAFAYWIRPRALQRLMALHHHKQGGLSGMGTVFILPPANIPTLFAYCWALSLLCGNRSFVRLSLRLSASAQILMRLIKTAFADFPELAEGQFFLSYGHEDEITHFLSGLVDLRMVWGGDETVRHIRSIPLAPLARDLCFGDRFSLSMIKAKAVLDGNDETLGARFYADVYPFDQMACSSPRLIAIIGEEQEAEEAKKRLFASLAEAAEQNGYVVDSGVVSAKLAYAYRAILDGPVRRLDHFGGFLSVASLSEFYDFRENIHGGGMLFALTLQKAGDLVPHIVRKDQTLTHYGFDDDELRELAQALNGRGIDRMVPVGQALAFDAVWDGIDLIAALSRVVIRKSG